MLSPDFSIFPDITTSRLLLRKLTLADAPAVQRLRSNTEVMKYNNRPLTLTIQDAEAWVNIVIEELEKANGITWCMCLKEAPAEHVGNIGLFRIDKVNHRAEIGYALEPLLHGRGLMYEAIQQVLHYGFHDVKLHSIEALIDPRNLASEALLKKAGFVQEGYFKESYNLRDQFVDTAVYSLLIPYKQAAIIENEAEKTGTIS